MGTNTAASYQIGSDIHACTIERTGASFVDVRNEDGEVIRFRKTKFGQFRAPSISALLSERPSATKLDAWR